MVLEPGFFMCGLAHGSYFDPTWNLHSLLGLNQALMFSQAPLPVLDSGGHTIQNIARTSFNINKSFQINVMYRARIKIQNKQCNYIKKWRKFFFLASLVRIFFTSPPGQTETNITIWPFKMLYIIFCMSLTYSSQKNFVTLRKTFYSQKHFGISQPFK